MSKEREVIRHRFSLATTALRNVLSDHSVLLSLKAAAWLTQNILHALQRIRKRTGATRTKPYCDKPDCDKMSQREARQSIFDRHLPCIFTASRDATLQSHAHPGPVVATHPEAFGTIRIGVGPTISWRKRCPPALCRRGDDGANRCARRDRADRNLPPAPRFRPGPWRLRHG
jgi:hypothetical protein